MQGIMFIEDLTIATMEGRKGMTRRVIDPQPRGDLHGYSGNLNTKTGENRIFADFTCGTTSYPKYKVGEVLYIKEPWAEWFGGRVIYQYDATDAEANDWQFHNVKWNNKQGMPARFARTFIRITGVNAERLQDITEEDAIREGVMPFGSGSGRWVCYDKARCRRAAKMDGYAFCGSACSSFSSLWDSLANPGQKWEDNPWVWVYDYELTTKPE